MKRKLTQAEFDALSEEMQALYKAVGDSFVLDIEDEDNDDELDLLKKKKDIEAEHRRKAEKRNRELEKELEDLKNARLKEDDDEARKNKDIEALDKSWKAKFEAREAELTGQVNQYKSSVEHLLIDGKATEIATRLSEVPELLAPVIRQRLRVEYNEGKPTTRVVDAQGELSALTLEDLEKEIAGDKRYAPVIIASKSSGGGSRGSHHNPGGAKKKFSELSDQERIDWHRADPEGFLKASQEANT